MKQVVLITSTLFYQFRVVSLEFQSLAQRPNGKRWDYQEGKT